MEMEIENNERHVFSTLNGEIGLKGEISKKGSGRSCGVFLQRFKKI